MAAFHQRAGIIAAAFAATLLAGACLVPDVEFVNELPGSGGSTNGSGGRAGSPSTGATGDGGDDAVAGADSGGTSSAGSSGSNQGGTPNPGGSAGMGQGGSAGAGGSGPIGEIPTLDACADPSMYLVCDDFEQGAVGGWMPGTSPTEIGDAPSGQNVLVTGFEPNQLTIVFNSIKISFWVRLQAISDQRFLSFPNDMNGKFGLGIEESRLRWMYVDGAGQAGPVVAPTDNAQTRVMTEGVWFCVEVGVDALGIFEARVVVPGFAPFVLPVLDGNPTVGVDQQWNASYPNWYASGTDIIFGQSGAYQEFDDVMIGDYDRQSLCDLYLEGVN